MRVSGVVPFGVVSLVDLHVYCPGFVSWPGFSQGFPSMCHYHCSLEWKYHWASRFVGLPNCTVYGLRHRPASMYLTVFISPGLPLCRASPLTQPQAFSHAAIPVPQPPSHTSTQPLCHPATHPSAAPSAPTSPEPTPSGPSSAGASLGSSMAGKSDLLQKIRCILAVFCVFALGLP